jgi:hypothetical protein
MSATAWNPVADPLVAALAQPACQHAACGAAADDQGVNVLLEWHRLAEVSGTRPCPWWSSEPVGQPSAGVGDSPR